MIGRSADEEAICGVWPDNLAGKVFRAVAGGVWFEWVDGGVAGKLCGGRVVDIRPTSFAPIIERAITIVEQSGGQYHVLLTIAMLVAYFAERMISEETLRRKLSMRRRYANQEIKFEPNVMCEHVDKKLTFRASQLEDGDIIGKEVMDNICGSANVISRLGVLGRRLLFRIVISWNGTIAGALKTPPQPTLVANGTIAVSKLTNPSFSSLPW
ncbi:ubiquitin carboxyl-terminal hydrolase 12-like protein isoform X1 [Tanacetum coccineum]|uniref:Ubiquitin carboxyl-terminal hydrolase 12-like protein isoform X1 n=1 Tax=Tanacetum coccineum TaxID=301880 RepID=A0ABQ5HVE4_9ASTR